jgi:hypothetical protein
VLGTVAVATYARAQPDRAETLFEQGVQALEAGRYDEACPPIEESYKLDPRLGALFALAECEAKRGRVATAVARYEDYLTAYSKLPREKKAKQGDRAQVARQQLERLRPELPLLTLVLPPGAPEDTLVWCDGTAVSKSSMGRPMALDPGAHVITIRAPGVASSEVRLKLDRGQQMHLELTLASKADASPPTAMPSASPYAERPRGAVPTRAVVPSPDVQESRDNAGSSARRAGVYTAGSVGLVNLILGGVLGGLAIAQKSTIDADCKPLADASTMGCHSAGYAAADHLQKYGLWSTIAFGVGIAGAVTTVVLIATEPKTPSAPVRTRGSTRPTSRPITAAAGLLDASEKGAMLGIRGAW